MDRPTILVARELGEYFDWEDEFFENEHNLDEMI